MHIAPYQILSKDLRLPYEYLCSIIKGVHEPIPNKHIYGMNDILKNIGLSFANEIHKKIIRPDITPNDMFLNGINIKSYIFENSLTGSCDYLIAKKYKNRMIAIGFNKDNTIHSIVFSYFPEAIQEKAHILGLPLYKNIFDIDVPNVLYKTSPPWIEKEPGDIEVNSLINQIFMRYALDAVLINENYDINKMFLDEITKKDVIPERIYGDMGKKRKMTIREMKTIYSEDFLDYKKNYNTADEKNLLVDYEYQKPKAEPTELLVNPIIYEEMYPGHVYDIMNIKVNSFDFINTKNFQILKALIPTTQKYLLNTNTCDLDFLDVFSNNLALDVGHAIMNPKTQITEFKISPHCIANAYCFINEEASTPKYIITDGSQKQDKSVSGSVVILDEDYNIHSVVTGYAVGLHRFHEEFALIMAVRYCQKLHIPITEDICWITDTQPNYKDMMCDFYHLTMSSSHHYEKGQSYTYHLFLDGLCHRMANDPYILESLKTKTKQVYEDHYVLSISNSMNDIEEMYFKKYEEKYSIPKMEI